ncbi:hypothetical protein PPL_06745 [Heterostelium album PN500]|uniref:Uncharacterized protein n=1 Tax=Heterostelium pallidum (strain ATCC 26659 / Pp 5 / PN500) TaxID=670386 RepID=D3BFL1_HETP5|nr:hypothetical protein PPL_06745 [Heterostelium album PN500]EFA79925.1 hypothetical protein PPL_06745 [Heterostelium album PN500]|eukprot:XP_020432045.1 hypothetical protein PPL_06745 [Heterostelium album PN500]
MGGSAAAAVLSSSSIDSSLNQWSQGAPDKMALLQKRMEQGSSNNNQSQQQQQQQQAQHQQQQQQSINTVNTTSTEKMKLLQSRMETPNSTPTPTSTHTSKPKKTVIPFGITSPSKHQNQHQQHQHQHQHQHHHTHSHNHSQQQQQHTMNINHNQQQQQQHHQQQQQSSTISLSSTLSHNTNTSSSSTTTASSSSSLAGLNNQYSRLMSFFGIREHFFLYFILAYDNHQFYHHLQSSLVEKITILQSCQCSNNHNHSDYHERVTHLKSLMRLLAFIYMLPTENYQKHSMALQSPSFAEITTRTGLLPPPFDVRAMLMSAISSESLAVAVPCVIEFVRMADNVTRETSYFQELINILKNIYMLPTIIPTATQPFFNYTSIFIQLELEQYFESSNQSPFNSTHIALPFAGSSMFSVGNSPTTGNTPRTPTTPSKNNNNNNNSNNNNNTPTSPTHTKTPSKSNSSTTNNLSAIDLNPNVGYSLLWSYPSNSYLQDIQRLLSESAEFANALATASAASSSTGSPGNLSESNTPVSSPSKQLLSNKRKQIVPVKKITPLASQPSGSDSSENSHLQNQLEWWFFWSHPGLAKLSNLLQDTLLPFFTEMIFNLSIPITIKLSNSYLEDNRKLVSPTSSPSKPAGATQQQQQQQDGGSTQQQQQQQPVESQSLIIEGSRLQELVISVQQRLRSQASEKVMLYCQNNVRSLISMLTPIDIDDSVLSVATSMISRRLMRQADSICLPEVLQKARVLAIEIIAKKQTVSLNKTSLQLLNMSMSDVTKNNQQNYTVVGVAQSHLAVLEEVLDLRGVCTKLEQYTEQISTLLDAEHQHLDDNDNLIAFALTPLEPKLLSDIMTALLKANSLLGIEVFGVIVENPSTQLKNTLPILFKLVVHLLSNIMMYEYKLNPPQLPPLPLDNNNLGNSTTTITTTTSSSSSSSIATTTTSLSSSQNTTVQQQQQQQQEVTMALEELQQPLPINRLTGHKLGGVFVDLIKKMVKLHSDFSVLIPQYLLSHSRVFTIVTQSSTFTLEWLHSYDWILLTLLQDNVIDCISIEGCWNNLFDRCFTFLIELSSASTSTSSSTSSSTEIIDNNNNNNIDNNSKLLQIQTLQSLLKVICEFIKLYHFHFQAQQQQLPIIITSTTTVITISEDTTTTTNNNNNNSNSSGNKHPYSKLDFNLCLESFLQRLMKIKSSDRFKSITDLSITIDQSIQYLNNQIQSIFKQQQQK